MADDSPPDFSEIALSSRTVYRGELLHVKEDQVRLPDGKTATREYINHPGAVMIIALVDEETLILERQFRYPLNRHFIELPAGKVEKGEQPLASARRELVEECGYEAKHWRYLATLHPCIGFADERIELFLARDLIHVGGKLDAGEFLQVMPVKIAEALEWARAGKITDVKAVIGLLWLEKILRQEWA
jgi:ADP-ribose pyrophosphatase